MFFIELLEKNRHKRPTLEEVLDHAWFSDFQEIQKMRSFSNVKESGESRF